MYTYYIMCCYVTLRYGIVAVLRLPSWSAWAWHRTLMRVGRCVTCNIYNTHIMTYIYIYVCVYIYIYIYIIHRIWYIPQ